MSKTERQATVDSLTEQLKGSPNIFVTDFTGLSVLRMTELRRRLKHRFAAEKIDIPSPQQTVYWGEGQAPTGELAAIAAAAGISGKRGAPSLLPPDEPDDDAEDEA